MQPVSRRRHKEMLCVAALILVLAFVLQVKGEEKVIMPGLPAYPLPETCVARQLWGIRCPGCGLTRSFIFLAHGDWSASFRMHRLGWLLAAAVIIQLPYRALALRGRPTLPLWLGRLFGLTLIVLLIGNWLLEQIFGR